MTPRFYCLWLLVLGSLELAAAGPLFGGGGGGGGDTGGCDCQANLSCQSVNIGGNLQETCECGGETCSFAECCSGRRRQLTARADRVVVVASSNKNERHEPTPLRDQVTAYESCLGMSYQVSLVVETHLYGVAIPEDDEETKCPLLVLHTDFSTPGSSSVSDHVIEQQLLIWDDASEYPEHFDLSSASHSLGRFPLSTLVEALSDMSQNFAQQNNNVAAWDVLTNNCAGFLLQVARRLNIDYMDPVLTKFVAQRLLHASGQRLIESIKSSAFFDHFFGSDAVGLSDVAMVETMVSKIQKRYM